MSNRNLTILAVVAVIMVGWAVFQANLDNFKPIRDKMPPYLLGPMKIEDITSIRIIVENDEDIIRLIRSGKGFVVGNRSNYPAKTGEVNNLILSCMDLQPAELITDNKANHEDLGVSEENSRYIIRFYDQKAENPIGGFYISRANENNVVYARKDGQDKVYRIKEDKLPYISTMNFIESELINTEADKIESVTLTGPGGSYTLKKKDTESSEIVFDGPMPEGKQFKGNDRRWVFEALTSLRIDDVKKANELTEKLNFDNTYVCRLKDTTVYTLKIAKKEEKYYMTCTSQFKEISEIQLSKDESEEELKKKEAMLEAQDKSREFAQKHEGWIYEIPSYKAENLIKVKEDLLEDIKKEETEDKPSETPGN